MPSILRAVRRSVRVLAVASLVAAPLSAQQGPPPEVRTMIDGVVAMLRGSADSTLIPFADTQFAPAYRETFTGPKLIEHLQGLRAHAAAGDGGMSIRGAPGSVLISFDSGGTANIRLEWNDDLLITKLEAEPAEG